MSDIFRITDRFKITGRGIIYTIENDKDTIIRLGDILYDLHGSQFKVKGIEMIRKRSDAIHITDATIGLCFESICGAEVGGRILVRDLAAINFLFCNHPLYQHEVDVDYRAEYQAAGLEHACALFSYEDLQQGKLSLYEEKISGLTIYRGWMMHPDMYRSFYSLLEEQGIILINTPDEYEKYHLLPGWYNDFKTETPETVWELQGKLEAALQIAKQLEGPYVVKDYVKSRKHEWYDACFIESIDDRENAARVIGNFIDRQGIDLVGGIVLRKFEKLKKIGYHERSGMPLSEEYRVFIYAGKILAVDDYWLEDSDVNLSTEEYQWMESIAQRVKSNFVTVDLARKEDGSLIIMELGDGQVSGLQQIDAEVFYKTFK
ncbi:ATP-grasp domain-containing protein [Clostridium sp. AN503]|uniref:ATP-grasp domain-containing protein n=1 Tax=Clostridium sp. AN503 TaxID=3160598 RepID=UPI003459788F